MKSLKDLYEAKLCIGFHRQVFKHAQKCKWVPLTKLQWIPRTNTCNVNLVSALVLLRTPQLANIGNWLFRIPHMYTDSANVCELRKFMHITLTICRFRFQFADSTVKDFTTTSFLNSYIII